MRTVYKNGTVYTGNGFVTDFAVENGKFCFVGETDKATADEVVDLGGKFVCAGFNDSHMHVLNLGNVLTMANLGAHTTSLKEMLDCLRTYIKETGVTPGTWVQGRGFNHDYFADERRFPTRWDLDSVSTEHPICITRACGHICVVNSKALEVLGITKDTPQVAGGSFALGENGEPNGQFFENAVAVVYAGIPEPDEAQLCAMLRASCKRLNRYGITSCQSDDYETFPGVPYETVQKLLRTPGLMTVQEAIDAGMMHPNCTHRFVAVPPEIAGAKYEADGTPRKTDAAPQFALGDGKRDGFYAKGFTDAADREQHETAERAVRSVHALTGMPPVQIMRAKEHPFQPKAHGMTLRDPKTGYAERIEIYDASPNKAFTEVHEMGHAIDDFLGISSSATGRRLLNLLERTEPFYQVCEYEDRVRSWVDSNTKSAALTAINYFLRPDEQFARAYAQYIAEKSKNRILLAQLEKQDILSKWNDDDFREVRKEFDAILKLAGWIK